MVHGTNKGSSNVQNSHPTPPHTHFDNIILFWRFKEPERRKCSCRPKSSIIYFFGDLEQGEKKILLVIRKQ